MTEWVKQGSKPDPPWQSQTDKAEFSLCLRPVMLGSWAEK